MRLSGAGPIGSLHVDLDDAGEIAVARIAGHDEAKALASIEGRTVARPGDERAGAAAGRDLGERQRNRTAAGGGQGDAVARVFDRRHGDAAGMIEQRPQADADPRGAGSAGRGAFIARRPRQGLQLGEGEAARRIHEAGNGKSGGGLGESGRNYKERENKQQNATNNMHSHSLFPALKALHCIFVPGSLLILIRQLLPAGESDGTGRRHLGEGPKAQ